MFLPTLPSYLLSRFGARLTGRNPLLARILRYAPSVLDTISEINLAIFYFSGVYYSLVKRLLRVKNVSPVASVGITSCLCLCLGFFNS